MRTPPLTRSLAALATALLVLTGCASNSQSPGGKASGRASDDTSWLYVLNSDRATIDRVDAQHLTITLSAADANALAFTDRPKRRAGSESLAEFASHWNSRFGADPPQAALVADDVTPDPKTGVTPPTTGDRELERDSIVVTLNGVSVNGDTVTFSATTTSALKQGSALGDVAEPPGDIPAHVDFKDASLFVDTANGDAGAPATSRAKRAVADAGGKSPTPHLEAVKAKLRTTNPTSEGIAWFETTGNALVGSNDNSWLLQTPQCWGQTSCPTSSFERFKSAIRSSTSSARTVVDLTSLYPFPDGEFRSALVDGLASAYRAGGRPLVRIAVGVPPTYSIRGTSPSQYRDGLVSEISKASGVPAGEIRLAVASMASSWGWSWNHSKIISTDGREALIGGHNLWTADYLQTTDPIDDVTIHHRGPLAARSQDFADNLWGFICRYQNWPLNVDYAPTPAVADCPGKHPDTGPSAPAGDVTALSIGRLGMGIANPTVDGGPLPDDLATREDAWNARCSVLTDDYTNRGAPYERSNPGEPALRALISSATTSVTISQQDMIAICSAKIPPKWDVRVFDALADRISKKIPVNIVISSPGDWAYSNNGTLADVSSYLLSRVQTIVPGQQGKDLFCKYATVAPIRFNDTMDTWPNGKPIGNHAKVVAVDRQAFYVGSQNLYPAWLQEDGVIIENAQAAETFYGEYLDPMVKFSSRAKDTSQCA